MSDRTEEELKADALAAVAASAAQDKLNVLRHINKKLSMFEARNKDEVDPSEELRICVEMLDAGELATVLADVSARGLKCVRQNEVFMYVM